MAKKVYEEENIRAIAEKIREKTGTTKTYTTEEMPQGIEEVYSAGSSGGGYEEGFEDGKKSEYDAFWDSHQQNGERFDYRFAFANGWRDTIYKPKYPIKPTGSIEGMYQLSLMSKVEGIDTSAVTNFRTMFYYSKAREIGEIDVTKGTNLQYAFSNMSNLEKITKLIVSENTVFNTNTFTSDTNLTEITFEGVLAQGGLDLHWSTKLSKASIEGVIGCLSTSTSGLTVTLSKTAVNTAFETAAGAGDGSTSTEWIELTDTVKNWTISLV
jgi:hypothetical protein